MPAMMVVWSRAKSRAISGKLYSRWGGWRMLWPAESPLVHYEVADRVRPARRLVGLGDFRSLRAPSGGGEP
jgi:hypothetical protein